MAILKENYDLGIDTSSYCPTVDWKALWDDGVNFAIPRIGCTGRYVADDWRLFEDTRWRPSVDFIRSNLPNMVLGGYWPHNPGIARQDYERDETQMRFVERCISGNYKPDFMGWDVEVANWYEGSNYVTCTPSNLAKSVRVEMSRIWNWFRLPPVFYSALWFINRYAKMDLTTWLDNANAVEKTVASWFAFYPTLPNYTLNSFSELWNLVPALTSTHEDSYLSLGNNFYDCWQLAGNVTHPAVTNGYGARASVDVNVWRKVGSMGIYEYFGKTRPGSNPPPPPPDDGGIPPPPPIPAEGDLKTVLEELAKIEDALAKVETDMGIVKGSTVTTAQAQQVIINWISGFPKQNG